MSWFPKLGTGGGPADSLLEAYQPRLALYCFVYTFVSFITSSGRFKVSTSTPALGTHRSLIDLSSSCGDCDRPCLQCLRCVDLPVILFLLLPRHAKSLVGEVGDSLPQRRQGHGYRSYARILNLVW